MTMVLEPCSEDEMDNYRHWCPLSETYTGTDALLTILGQGWQIFRVVFRQDFWLAGTRRVSVYHFRLYRQTKMVRMAVIENPAVLRWLHSTKLLIIPFTTAEKNWLEVDSPQNIVEDASE